MQLFGKREEDTNSTSDKHMPFFKEDVPYECPQSKPNTLIDRGLILKKIRELAPISLVDVAKELNCSRNTIYYAVRDFEHAGLVETKVILSEKNTDKRIVIIPDNCRARLEEANEQN